jgi:Family of unknown function (DUF5677)
MTPREAIAKSRHRAAQLVHVVAAHFPRDIPSAGRHDDWTVTGPAFVARSTRLVQSVLALPDEYEAAAGVLARVLHEHVTTFAWLAIDPLNNLPQWVRRDRSERVKADNDMGVFGSRLLDPEVRTKFEAERDAIPDRWAGLAAMAQQADQYWSTRIKAFSTDLYGLRGMYLAMYRQFSALVHGMPESLHRVIGNGPRPGLSRVGVDEQPAENNAFTNTPFIYALGLLVSREACGFPEPKEVYKVFEQTR